MESKSCPFVPNFLLGCAGGIQYFQKVNGIVTMTGEKLHERQFIEAVHAAEEKSGLMTKFFVGFADMEKSAYHFYYEFADQSTTQEQSENFTRLVDEELKVTNIEYEAKRASYSLIEHYTT